MFYELRHISSGLIVGICVLAIGVSGVTWAHDAANGSNADATVDLDLTYVERFPRFDYDDTSSGRTDPQARGWPVAGSAVTFEAHVVNQGVASSGPYAWRVLFDGSVALTGQSGGLESGAEEVLVFAWTWEKARHMLRFEIDTTNTVPSEVSELNNVLEIETDALSAGFWMEESLFDELNRRQVEVGDGANSAADWAQRQIQAWNDVMRGSHWPLTPLGIYERMRLDKFIVVADGALPLAGGLPTNNPDSQDKTVDVMWGFPSSELASFADPNGRFFIDRSLIHELGHARYLIDLYGLNVHFRNTRLSAAIDSTQTTIPVVDTGGLSSFGEVVINGEAITYASKSVDELLGASRGSRGTTPRVHESDSMVGDAVLTLDDGVGNMIMGSCALPMHTWDALYITKTPGIMSSHPAPHGGVSEHSAWALERIAGERPVCGNQNAPCNLGEYLQLLPDDSFLRFVDIDGDPIGGAEVWLFQAQPSPGWYAERYLNQPTLLLTTNLDGLVNVGRNPFGDASIVHGYGFSNAVMFGRISLPNGIVRFFFVEVTDFNLAFGRGDTSGAIYTLQICATPVCEVSGRAVSTHTPSRQPLRMNKTQTGTEISWEDVGGAAIGADCRPETYNVYRGTRNAMIAGDFGSGLACGVTSPSFMDLEPSPPSGVTYVYLVSAVEGGIEGPLGPNRVNVSTCE